MVLREPKLPKSCSYFFAQFYNPPIMVRAAYFPSEQSDHFQDSTY